MNLCLDIASKEEMLISALNQANLVNIIIHCSYM